MPKITNETVEEGQVMGYVRTDMVGSKCTFPICSVEEWEAMSDSIAKEFAKDAMHESGLMEWGY